jgi:hypothetical protein
MEASISLHHDSSRIKSIRMVRDKTQPQRNVVRLRENCELCDIRLVESLCKQKLREGPLPDNLEIGCVARAAMSAKKGKIIYFPTLVAIARYDDSSDSESPLMIQAKYRVEYDLTENISDADERELQEFVHNAGNLHVWPYFRELVHSMTCKMGLPGLTIPLYDPSGFMSAVTEEITKVASLNSAKSIKGRHTKRGIKKKRVR